jgi:hypothetical protein
MLSFSKGEETREKRLREVIRYLERKKKLPLN